MQVNLTWEQWAKEFEPILNPSTGDAVHETVSITRPAEARNTWTIVNGYGGYLDIVNGYQFIDRLGYAFTRKAWDPEHSYYITNSN